MNQKIGVVSKNTIFFNLLNKERRYDQLISLELIKSSEALTQNENLGKKISTFIFDSTLEIHEIIEIGNQISNSNLYQESLVFLAFENFDKFAEVAKDQCFLSAKIINMPANPEDIYQKLISSFNVKNKNINKATQSDAMFLNVFINSTIATIKEMASCGEIEYFSPTLLDYKTMNSEIAIRGCLDIDSPYFKGSFYISFPKDTFLNICKRVLADESMDINESNEDLVSEFCNIVYGKSKVIVSDLNMGLGMVIPTRNRDQKVVSDSKVLVVKMNSEFGSFFVKIAPRVKARKEMSIEA